MSFPARLICALACESNETFAEGDVQIAYDESEMTSKFEEVVVEESFEAAARATTERMAALTPEERLAIHYQLLRMIYPDGLDSRIQGTFEIVQR